MRITSVRMRNFCTHEDKTVEFSAGVNLIIGGVGSGKSSIVKAIHFALTGDPLTGRKDEAIKWKESSGSVELKFEHNGVEGVIKRSLHSSDASLVFGTQRVGSARAIADAIDQIFGIPVSMISAWSFAQQGGLTSVFAQPASERNRQFQTLFRTDDCEKRRSRVADWKSRVEASMQKSADSSVTLTDEINTLSSDLRRTEAEMQSLGGDSREAIDRIGKELTRARSVVARYNDLNYGHDATKARIAQIDSVYEKTEQGERESQNTLRQREAELESHRELAAKARASIQHAQEIAARMQHRQDLLRQQGELNAALDNFVVPPGPVVGKETFDEWSNSLERLSGQVRDIERFVNAVEHGDGRCPTCGTVAIVGPTGDISDFVETLEKAKKARDDLSIQVLDLRSKVTTWRRDSDEVQAALRAVSDLQSKWDSLSSQLERLPPEIVPDVQSMTAAVQRETELLHLHRLAKQEAESASRSLVELVTQRSALLDKLAELAALQPLPDVSILEVEWQEAQERSRRWSSLEGQAQQIRRHIADLERRLQRVQEIERQFDSAKSCRDMLEQLCDVLHRDQYPAAVARMYHSRINSAWNSLLEKLGTPFSVSLAHDGEVHVRFVDQVVPFRTASGGQQCAVALTFWLVAMRLFTRTGLLVLDEPTYGLDQHVYLPRVSDLLSRVDQYTRSEGSQVIIVTHEQMLCPSGRRIEIDGAGSDTTGG